MKYLIFILLLGSCVGKPKVKSEIDKACDSMVAQALARGWPRDKIHAPCDIDSVLIDIGSGMDWHSSGELRMDSTLYFKHPQKPHKKDTLFISGGVNDSGPSEGRWSRMAAKAMGIKLTNLGVAGRTLDVPRGDCANNPITKSNNSVALFAMGDEDCLYDNGYRDTTPKHFIIYDKSKIPGYPEYDSARRKTIGKTDVREGKLTLYWDSVPRHQYGYMLDSKEKITLWDRNGNGYSFDSVGNLIQNGKPLCHCDTVSRRPQDSVIHFGAQYEQK